MTSSGGRYRCAKEGGPPSPGELGAVYEHEGLGVFEGVGSSTQARPTTTCWTMWSDYEWQRANLVVGVPVLCLCSGPLRNLCCTLCVPLLAS
jgi:hypothetical protein